MATELVPLGTPITDPKVRRDAFHIACVPSIVANGHFLHPAQRVGIYGWQDEKDGTKTPLVGPHDVDKPIVGVADAFLSSPAVQGQRIWVMLLPNTVTGMRHAFRSPDFPDELVIREDPETEARNALLRSIPGFKR